jgi:beta-glucosidase
MNTIPHTRREFLRRSALLAASTTLPALLPAAEVAAPATAPASPDGGLVFPPDFLLGVASAAYQIEGAWDADGKGESIWDRWSHEGRGQVTGDVVADHYHRYPEDIGLLQQLGINSYRFSIAWTRIFPTGKGAVNPAGLAYYKDLVRRLKAAGIRPAITLYHWDLPQALEEAGGWANPETAVHYEAYARLIFRELGADVSHWITFNEPWVTAFCGYWLGNMAPGKTDFNTALAAIHTILLAHGRAVKAFRESKSPGQIGITLDLFLGLPASPGAEDQRAAELINQSHHGWFADPIFKGDYPALVVEQYHRYGYKVPGITAADRALIRQPIDFLGLNYYNSDTWRHDPKGWVPYEVSKVNPEETNLLKPDWQPDGLEQLLKRLHHDYSGIDILVTENGLEAPDFLNHRGEIHDDARIEYIYQHLAAGRRALDAGVNLKGYFVWSFLDDYEWGKFGRMGLVHVDFKTLQRTIKQSGYWYRDGIARRAFALP